MSRPKNIYYGVVNSENSMTELFCNYMAFKPFRTLFLELFLNKEELENFSYNDFQTQYTVELNRCRPDILVSNDDYEILIEVKTSNSGLTDNQPLSYLQHLQESKKENTYLIFLIPKDYKYENEWSEKMNGFMIRFPDSKVKTKIIYWNEIIQAIHNSGLFEMSEKVNDIFELLKSWFEVPKMSFTNREVNNMLTQEIPQILKKLFEIVNVVKDYSGKEFKGRITSNYYEYTVYFQDKNKNDILFFGVWYDIWNEYGIPLCYGVDNGWDDRYLSNFKNRHQKFLEKDGYVLDGINNNILSNENASEEIARLIYNELDMLNRSLKEEDSC